MKTGILRSTPYQRHCRLPNKDSQLWLLKRYAREVETSRINRMFSTHPFKVYSQWQGNRTRTDSTRAETEQCRKNLWEKEATQNTNAQWLFDLRADHSNLSEQDPVTIMMADIQERPNEELDSTRHRHHFSHGACSAATALTVLCLTPH